jgi:hypothetical protein
MLYAPSGSNTNRRRYNPEEYRNYERTIRI